MDKLLALRMFIETVEAGSFSAAARRQAIATSTVTRMVSALEEELQTTLLNRSTRQVTVTEAGDVYYRHAHKILDDLADADEQVKDGGDEPSGPLRVSVPLVFGRDLIAPQLGAFIKRYPKVALDLMATDSISDLLGESIDLAVRLGAPAPMEGVISRTLGCYQRWVVASPGYLARRGTPAKPADLAHHDCLRFNYGEGHAQVWTFRHQQQEQRITVRGAYRSNNADILRAVALADGGVAQVACWLVRQDVQEGRLRRLFADYAVTPNNSQAVISALYLPSQRHSRRVNAFLEFFKKILPPYLDTIQETDGGQMA